MESFFNNRFTKTGLPISFIYGGRHSAEFIGTWKSDVSEKKLDGNTILKTYILTDPDTGLLVKAEAKIFTDTPGTDWTVYFTNTGNSNTPILESVRPLNVTIIPDKAAQSKDIKFEGLMFAQNSTYVAGDEDLPLLSRIKGSIGCAYFSFDEFQPIQNPVRKGEKHIFGSEVYRSSFDKYSPFFEISWRGGGVVTAIGWTGKWTASVEGLEDGNINVSAGMSDLHTYLLPGETIRTPRIMQVYWSGNDPDRGYNLFRQAMFRHVMPKFNGSLVFPPIASLCMLENLLANQGNQMKHITKDMEELGFEVYWLDAWWHKWAFPKGMGNYSFPIEKAVDPDRFPGGIKPLSEAAHERGYRFLLWFAPETAWEDTFMMQEHPEWLLYSAERKDSSATLNLGIPEAREYITEFMNTCIKEWDIDIWRTDSGPAYGQIKDNDNNPDRQGILEMRYYEGVYKLWDDLLAQNPGLMIDNCCGGGTRIDLETCYRSIPLWRTDSQVWTSGAKDYMRTAALNEIINASLNRYVPFGQSGTMGIDPYYVRGGFNGGLTFFDTPPEDACSRKILKKAISECKRLRKYITGDFYRLVFQTHDPREWCVYQYHLYEEETGAIIAFRRQESPFPLAELTVKGIEPEAEYELSYYETYDLMKTERLKGSDMMKLVIGISSKPGSLLIEYKRFRK